MHNLEIFTISLYLKISNLNILTTFSYLAQAYKSYNKGRSIGRHIRFLVVLETRTIAGNEGVERRVYPGLNVFQVCDLCYK